MSATKRQNFLRQFKDESSNELKKLSSIQFMEIWNHYDSDGNGYIEGKELDSFLRELSSANSSISGSELIPESMMADIKQAFLDAYDEDKDGKISISEMAEILPTEENFLVLFRKDNLLDSTADFMKIWFEFDKDKSGFIESDELKSFLRKAIQARRFGEQVEEVSEEKLDEYTSTILALYDSNSDGKLQLSEMIKLLSVKQNMNVKSILKTCSAISNEQVDSIFKLYDQDENDELEGSELDSLVKDILEHTNKNFTAGDLISFKNGLVASVDKNNDGKINKEELKAVLLTFMSISE